MHCIAFENKMSFLIKNLSFLIFSVAEIFKLLLSFNSHLKFELSQQQRWINMNRILQKVLK